MCECVHLCICMCVPMCVWVDACICISLCVLSICAHLWVCVWECMCPRVSVCACVCALEVCLDHRPEAAFITVTLTSAMAFDEADIGVKWERLGVELLLIIGDELLLIIAPPWIWHWVWSQMGVVKGQMCLPGLTGPRCQQWPMSPDPATAPKIFDGNLPECPQGKNHMVVLDSGLCPPRFPSLLTRLYHFSLRLIFLARSSDDGWIEETKTRNDPSCTTHPCPHHDKNLPTSCHVLVCAEYSLGPHDPPFFMLPNAKIFFQVRPGSKISGISLILIPWRLHILQIHNCLPFELAIPFLRIYSPNFHVLPK